MLLWPADAAEAPAGSFRRVLIILPESPSVSLVIGPMSLSDASDIAGIDDSGATPSDIADGRSYQWPAPASAGEVLKVHLTPENWIAAISHEGMANIALIVEYLTP